MKRYNRWNNIVGWAVFAVAALTYLATMEPSASLWDCSEFIATSYKLEVGHPPGAPLFMMMARLATMLAPSTEYVPLMVNAMNSLASAFCILFMFWTVTHLGRRIYSAQGRELTDANMWTVLGAGAVGALAYTFTDTFWFSAYEGEVYALSSMFTALVVWLMLKWEDQADEPHAARWLILIAYLMGLSIGIHILNLLTVPALVYIYYFRKYATVTFKGFCIASVIALAILWFINGLIIPYTVYIGAMVDVLFVNTFGLPVNSGITLFALSLFALLGWSVWYTHRRGRVVWNTLLLATTMILLGYSSYATVTIRAAANPPMNSNDPSNPHALFSVLNRDQYGGPGRKRRRVDALLHRRRRPLCHGLLPHGLHPPAAVHAPLPPHVELRQEPRRIQTVGSLPHQGGDAARRAGQRPARRERAAAARRGARLRHEAHLRRRLLRAARHHGADLFGESQLLLLLPAQLHVLALFPVELRRPPERHPTRRFDDDHRRQLAVGNRRDRPHLPGAAGESAARSG